jgi:hypothetical protein
LHIVLGMQTAPEREWARAYVGETCTGDAQQSKESSKLFRQSIHTLSSGDICHTPTGDKE